MTFSKTLGLLLLIALPTSAMAQSVGGTAATTPPMNFGQFPSFIEMNSTFHDGTQMLLRCGYAQNGSALAPDATYFEITLLNAASGAYLRSQHIDDKIITTSPLPNNQGRFVVQVTEPSGMVVAKNCQGTPDTDQLQGCMSAIGTIPASQTAAQDKSVAKECSTLFAKSIPQLSMATFDPQKTELFKGSLRQKAQIIENP